MSNPWINLVTTKEALEKEQGRLEARLEEVIRDIPTARANVAASRPSKDEAERVLQSLESTRNDLVKKISEVDDALKQLATAPAAASGSTSSSGGVAGKEEKSIRTRLWRVFKGFLMIFGAIVLVLIFWNPVVSLLQNAQSYLQENIHISLNFSASVGNPSETPAASLPPRATPEPTLAPTPKVTHAPVPTPSAKPGYIPPPADALVCTSTKFDLAGRTSLAGITLGGYNNVQFYWNSADLEKATLVPPGQENREFANPALGANWAFSPSCSMAEVQTQTQASVNIRQNLPNAENPYFRADWQTSGLYN